MVKIFDFSNYRKFIEKKLKEYPNEGYGQLGKLASFIGVHPTLVSQILKGHKSLTTDQAAKTAEFFGLGEIDAEYLVLLAAFERAGNQPMREMCRRQMNRLKEKSQKIVNRVTADIKLSEEQRAVFYSDWAYSAIRQAIALPQISSVNELAAHLNLPIKKVQVIVDFLLMSGLSRTERGDLKVGPASTHVEASSPWTRVHHTNWRHKALQSLDSPHPEDLHYTSPLTLSKDDAKVVRERLLQSIEEVNRIVDPSPSESLFCLNFDWFQVLRR